MKWEKPSFVQVKMDAEINSYQDDLEDIPDIQIVRDPSAAAEVSAVPHEGS